VDDVSDPLELERIWSKTDEQKLIELCDNQAAFCADMVYLLDHHLDMVDSGQIRDGLTELRQHVLDNPDEYVLENIMLLTMV